MGMVMPASAATLSHRAASEGLFSAVTGLKRSESSVGISSGMMGALTSHAGGAKRLKMASSSASNSVTVASKQFVFGVQQHDQNSHMGEVSNMGGASLSAFGHSNGGTLGAGMDSQSGIAKNSKAMSAMASRMSAPAGGLSTPSKKQASKKHMSISSSNAGNGNGEKKSLFRMVAQA